MRRIDIIKRAGRNLRHARMRTILTVLAISVGGFAITASLMAGEGARQYIDRIIANNINPKGLIIVKDKKLVQAAATTGAASGLREYNPNATSYYGQDYESVTQADIDKLRQNKQIKNVEPLYQLQPKYIDFSNVKDKKYIGNVMMRDNSIRTETAAGKPLDAGVELKADEAVLPESYLKTLGVKHPYDIIGQKLTVVAVQTPQKVDNQAIAKAYAEGGEAAVRALVEPKELRKEFTIVAVTKKSPDQMANQSSISIAPSAAKEISEFSTVGTDAYQKYLTVTATTADGILPNIAKESLEKSGFHAMTARDAQQMLFQFVNILQTIVLSFGVLALIVSVFGIVNTQYISVLERTQQIGLMKALGASRRDIGKLFRYESAWIGFFGGAVGILLAWITGAALNPAISNAIGLGKNHLLIFTPSAGIIVLVLLVVVAMLAGFFPSRKAAKLDPIEALRTE